MLDVINVCFCFVLVSHLFFGLKNFSTLLCKGWLSQNLLSTCFEGGMGSVSNVTITATTALRTSSFLQLFPDRPDLSQEN